MTPPTWTDNIRIGRRILDLEYALAEARAQLTEARNAVLREGLEVERLRPVVEAAVAWHEAGCDLYAAVDTFNAARKDT